MKKDIPLAINLTKLLNSTGELEGVEAVIPAGLRDKVDGIEVRVYSSNILLRGGKKGEFTYYRYASPPINLYKCEYKAPIPDSHRNVYLGVEEVHLIYIPGEGRKDEFTEIPFP